MSEQNRIMLELGEQHRKVLRAMDEATVETLAQLYVMAHTLHIAMAIVLGVFDGNSQEEKTDPAWKADCADQAPPDGCGPPGTEPGHH